MHSIARNRVALALAAAALTTLCLAAPGLASGPTIHHAPRSHAAAQPAELYGVDGTSHSDVWAVGQIVKAVPKPVIDHFDGASWTRSAIAGAVGQQQGYASSVSALTPTDAWAVGSSRAPSGQKPMILRWDGTSWNEVPAPQPRAAYVAINLEGVSADSASDAWAVGWYLTDLGVWKPLALHWDGSAWSIVSMPAPGRAHGTVSAAVTAISPTDAWLVGNYRTGSARMVLTEHWDGTAWKRVPTPVPAGSDNELDGVSAISGTDVWAVGGYAPPGGAVETLALHWDGMTWTTVATPSAGSFSILYSVSGSSTTQAWAVGDSLHPTGKTLTLHWDGSTWTRVPSPNISGSGTNELRGVWTRTSADAIAVGTCEDIPDPTCSNDNFAAILMHWGGAHWLLR